jgi:hypothetical protein
MAIPAKQIGWSQQSNLLWEISKQLDRINSVVCTGPCPTTTTTTTIEPTTTTTTTALCNYLYEGVLTVGGDVRGSGYQSGGTGAIDPIDANFNKLFYSEGSLSLSIITDCYSTIDVYINGTIYTLIPNLTPGDYYLDVDPNPFPPIGETCIIQICPGELCP